MSSRLGYLYVTVAAAGWALIGLFTRELGHHGMRASEVATWRALLGGACFVLHAVLGRRRSNRASARERNPIDMRTAIELAVFSLIGVTVFFASVPLAVEAGGITIAYVLLYTAPAWVALGAATFLGERLGALDVVMVGVTLLGAGLVSAAGGAHVVVSGASIGWGLASGATYASYYLLGRRLFERLGASATFAICLPVGGVVLAVLVRPSWPHGGSWLLLAGLATVSTWLPYLCLSAGLARVPSSRAVLVATSEPVMAAVIGAAVYDERLGAIGIVGGGLVLASAAVSSLRR